MIPNHCKALADFYTNVRLLKRIDRSITSHTLTNMTIDMVIHHHQTSICSAKCMATVYRTLLIVLILIN